MNDDRGKDGLQLDVTVPAAGVALEGYLTIPAGARAIVAFAHGSGSGRNSPRNQYVAQMLRDRGLGTLLFDLLTENEATTDNRTGHLRFDISRLGQRVTGAVDWLANNRDTERLTIGLFGASTGAAAALLAAAERQSDVAAVVSRGGRPDLAGPFLGRVKAPTLLIVGGNDTPVIGMNRDAFDQLQCEKRMEIVPGATHLFEEPGALEQVTRLAADWFLQHLARAETGARAAST
jgi:dienelactone hydrolase